MMRNRTSILVVEDDPHVDSRWRRPGARRQRLCHSSRVNLLRGNGRPFNEFAGTNLDRIGGISDGIFAVSMTLLVLGLAVPKLSAPTEGDLWPTLVRRRSDALEYALRFIDLGLLLGGQAHY